MREKAIIVGSSPKSLELGAVNLDRYHKIAVNKSWRIRRDFDTHVFLMSLPDDEHPPLTSGIRPISVREFTPILRGAGGLYLTSGSVAMVAGYWAIATRGPHFLSYYGCDLVFPTGADQQTHFYGQGDSGPLVGNFEYNLRQRERSIRLLCWGLLHGTVVTNASAVDGTLLAFPKAPLDLESPALLDDILSSRETMRLVRKAANVMTFEMSRRTPAFRQPQKVFENDPDAIAAMNSIMDAWHELEPFVAEYSDRVTTLFNAAEKLAAAGRTEAPSEVIAQTSTDYDLVVHVGAPSLQTTVLGEALNRECSASDRVKLVPERSLRNFYTKIHDSFLDKGRGDFDVEKRSVEIAKSFSNRLFQSLQIEAGDRVVLSDPRALGSAASCAFTGKLYPRNNKALSSFASNLPAEPTEVHVSIVSYASFFAHAYYEFLGRAQADRFLKPEVMAAKVIAQVPSWLTTLEGIALCFPYSKLHVWCVDDADEGAPQMVAAIAGTQQDPADAPEMRYSTAEGKAGAHVAQFMSILRQSGINEALEKWRFIQSSAPKQKAAFDPWTREQRDHLDRLYAMDLDVIRDETRYILHETKLVAVD